MKHRKSAEAEWKAFFRGEPNLEGKTLIEIWEHLGLTEKSPDDQLNWLNRYGREHGRKVPELRESQSLSPEAHQELVSTLTWALGEIGDARRARRIAGAKRDPEAVKQKADRDQRIVDRGMLLINQGAKKWRLSQKVRESLNSEPGEKIRLTDRRLHTILEPCFRRLNSLESEATT